MVAPAPLMSKFSVKETVVPVSDIPESPIAGMIAEVVFWILLFVRAAR